MWPKDLGLGGLSQACSHTCTQSIWKWCVWTHKYEPYPGLWHPWLLLKHPLSQKLSRICSWEIAQPHTGIQIFFPEFYTCFTQQKSRLEKSRKKGIKSINKEKMLFFHFVPRVLLSYSSRSLQRNSFIPQTQPSDPPLLASQVCQSSSFIILQRALNHSTEDTECSCFSTSASGENVLGFWDSSMLLRRDTGAVSCDPEQQLSWVLLWPQTPWGQSKSQALLLLI